MLDDNDGKWVEVTFKDGESVNVECVDCEDSDTLEMVDTLGTPALECPNEECGRRYFLAPSQLT